MASDQFRLPNGRTVLRVFGVRHPGDGSVYLNGVRMGAVKEKDTIAIEYHNMKQIYALRLANEVANMGATFDAVVTPPSSRDDVNVYRNAILRHICARELSGFTRKGAIKAGENGTALADVIDEFEYAPDGQEREIRSLLIIDDIAAKGKTTAAILEHLYRNGMPEDAQIMLAVWAVV